MMRAPATRRWLLGIALTATVAAALWDGGDTPEPVTTAKSERPVPPRGGARAAAPLPEIKLGALDQKMPRDPVADAFVARSWEPPPVPVKVAPPPPPRAPALPYTYVGKILEDGASVVFVARQNRNYAVKKGDTLDATYRVDEITGTEMVLTYLPLDQRQSLRIGAAN